MRKMFPAGALARDARFVRSERSQTITDPRRQGGGRAQGRFDADSYSSAERARGMMHGILVGEIQALEGAGRTCWDFEVGDGPDQVPYELKLDMARQCWDEARHCETSVKLADHMGWEIGEFAESAFLYEVAGNPDPALRLAGVNRALEGLAIDVFNTMRQFGAQGGDPVLHFCGDWMLADEVTHVKMGSTWLRQLTVDDPDRRTRALEFQRVVDKLFSFNGLRGEDADSPVQLARRFRELAGFSTSEIDDIADMASEAREEAVEGAIEAIPTSS